MTPPNNQTATVTQADRDAAETFGNAWGMGTSQKFGLANLLARHRVAALEEAARACERAGVANANKFAAIVRALKVQP